MRRSLSVFVVCCFLQAAPLFADDTRAAKPSAGDLIKQLGDEDPAKAQAAAKALGRRAPSEDVSRALTKALGRDDARVKLAAAEALVRLKHPADKLVPVFAELLTAEDADVRAASAWRLGRMGGDAKPAVPTLAAALRDESREVRVQVGQALANLGDVAEPALPALLRALADRHSGVESVSESPAMPALIAMADKALPVLIASFRTKRDNERVESEERAAVAWRVAHALPAFGPRVLPLLVRALGAKDAPTRRYAAVALREVAKESRLPGDLADKLESLMDDGNEHVRAAAADATSWVRPANAKAFAILAKANDDFVANNSRFHLLIRLAPHNEGAREALIEKSSDEDKETATRAAGVLAGCPLPADVALKTWSKALTHPEPEVRRVALAALAALGSAASSAKPALHGRLAKETDFQCKSGILYALTAIDPGDVKLMPLLIGLLDHDDSWMRSSARECLTRLGPLAKDALPKLKESLAKRGPTKASRESREWQRDYEAHALVHTILSVEPRKEQAAAFSIATLRNPDVRAAHSLKGAWSLRNDLEDGLYALLPKSAPLLREALKDKDAEVRHSAALTLLRAGMDTRAALRALKHFDGRGVHLLARRPLPDAEAIAAAWCEGWRSFPDQRWGIEAGLLVLQAEALPHLLTQLREAKTQESRRDLAYLLARFDGQSKVAVPILRKELSEPKHDRQLPAIVALGQLGPSAAAAVPELVELLDSPRPTVQAAASKALARIGVPAKRAVPRLKKMLDDPKQEMRYAAAIALGAIDPSVGEALTLLRDDLMRERREPAFHKFVSVEVPDDSAPRGEVVSLGTLAAGILRFGSRAAPMLAEILEGDLDEWTPHGVSAQCGAFQRIQAALLLAELGPDAAKAVPALTRALGDRDAFVRDAAASALGRIGPAAKDAAPAVITLLKEQTGPSAGEGAWSSLRRGSGLPTDFRSLGRGGAKPSREVIGYGLFSPPQFPYAVAEVSPRHPSDPAYVLSRIDAKECSALPVLQEAAKDADHPARLAAALCVWRCGRESPELIRAFVAALDADAERTTGRYRPFDREDRMPREVRECLAELGTELKPAMGALARWLKRRHDNADTKDGVDVIGALGRLGPVAREHVALLRPLLRIDGWDARKRVAAASALCRIVGDRDRAFAVLREVLSGPEERAWRYHSPDRTDVPRVHAARALGELAEKGDKPAAALLATTAKGDANPHVRAAALEALARLKARGVTSSASERP